MKYYCLQLNDYDCGYAVIKMLLANINNDKNYLFMKENITKKSYSLLELKKIGEKYNLNLKGFEVKDFKLVNKFPFIALININKQNHYVLVNKITKNYIYYFDPKLKKQKVEINTFKNLFTGYILMIDNYKRTKCDNYYKSFKNYYFVYSIVFNLIQFILLFLSSFVLNNIYQLSIMVILFFIIMIFNQIFNNIILKKYDKKIVYSSINKDNSFENIKNEFNLKKDYFSYYQNIIYKSSILSFLILFLLINDIKNLLFIFCITLFIYFKELILFEINQPLKFNNYLLELNNDYVRANSLAYSIINKINLFNILKYVLIVICDFIICIYNNNFSPFIYYLIINGIIYDNLNYLYINDDYLLLNKELLIHLHVN